MEEKSEKGEEKREDEIISREGENDDNEEKHSLMLRLFLAILCVVLLAVAFFFKPVLIDGISMENTLFENDYAYSKRYIFDEPQRYDVAVVKYSREHKDTKRTVVKRIVGMPGDRIVIKDGQLTINGEAIKEPYAKGVMKENVDITLDKRQYFILGDNREHSFDSRRTGPVSRSEIVSHVVYVLLPFERNGKEIK